MTTLDGIPLFKGEAMLLSWGDTSSRGKTVTFALHEDDCGTSHPFRDLGTGKHGQRFQIVAVPITDDGNPIPPGATTEAAIGSAAADHPPPPERSAAPGGAKRERTLPEKVGMLCNDFVFLEWLHACGHIKRAGDATEAAHFVRTTCGVRSRADILPGTEAAFKWNGIVCEFEAATNRMAEERRR